MTAPVDTILAAGPALAAGIAAGRLLGALATRRVRRQLAAARRAAGTDVLTGLANRAALVADLAARRRAGRPHALVLFDLDGFKAVNDTYGHDAGDALLVQVADRLADMVAGHPDAVVARLGGDEFVVAASSPAPAVSALLGHDVVIALARPCVLPGGDQVAVRASVGVVHASGADDPRRVLRAADTAMYQAKAAGGDGVVEHDVLAGLPPVDDQPAVRLRDMTGLGRALRGVA